MRISLIGWRRSSLGIVTAVAFASGLQITGCVRSSSRDVGADLSRRAADAAIKAERAIADRNSRQPIFGSKDAVQSSIADSKTSKPDESRSGLYENPLAELLASKADRYPSGDPFIDTDNVVATPAKKITQTRDNQSDRAARADNIQLTQHESRVKATDDGSAIAKPISARNYQKHDPATIDSEVVGKVSVSNSWAKKERQQATLPIREEKSVAEMSAQRDDNAEFANSDLGFWKTADGNEKFVARSQSSSSDSQNPRLISEENWSQQSAHKQHVISLIEQSSNQHARGELHAAYRSALLASSLVDQYQLPVAADDVNPTIVAQEISAQIWGGSRKSEVVAESNAAVKEEAASDLPIIRPRQARSAQHDRVFQTPDSFLNWQASATTTEAKSFTPEIQSVDVSTPFEEASRQSPQSDVRSALFASSSQQYKSKGDGSSGSNEIRQTANAELFHEENWLNADADLLTENEHNASEASCSRQASKPLTAKPMPRQIMASKDADQLNSRNTVPTRSPLFAPIQEVNPFAANLERTEVESTPEQIEEADVSTIAVSEVQPKSHLKWGVVAFILATLSTLIGLKLNKAPVTQSSPKDEQSEEDDHHLKISKAA